MKKVTYSQLAKALALLGFEKIERNDFTAFSNVEYDALVVLPKGTAGTSVSSAHLITAEHTVTGKGITSSDEFTRILDEARPPVQRVHIADRTIISRLAGKQVSKPRRKLRSDKLLVKTPQKVQASN